MAASFEDPQQVQGASTDGEIKDDVMKNDFTVDDPKPDIGMDHPQGNFYEESQHCFLVESHVKSEIEAETEKETKIESNNNHEETTTENEREINMSDLDLDLNPIAPEASENNSPNPMNPPPPSCFENQGRSYISSNNNNKESDDVNVVGGCSSSGAELRNSLTVMGCNTCLLYVMVLKFYPECPKCKNTNLLDVVGKI